MKFIWLLFMCVFLLPIRVYSLVPISPITSTESVVVTKKTPQLTNHKKKRWHKRLAQSKTLALLSLMLLGIGLSLALIGYLLASMPVLIAGVVLFIASIFLWRIWLLKELGVT